MDFLPQPFLCAVSGSAICTGVENTGSTQHSCVFHVQNWFCIFPSFCWLSVTVVCCFRTRAIWCQTVGVVYCRLSVCTYCCRTLSDAHLHGFGRYHLPTSLPFASHGCLF